MLEEWTVANFKSISGRTTLPLGAITILAGANSSGKSALLQSMLLVAQTLNNRVTDRPVVLNGHILRLGTFTDILSTNAKNADITLGFKYRAEGSDEPVFYPQLDGVYHARMWYADTSAPRSIACEFSFSGGDSATFQLQPRLEKCEIAVTQSDKPVLHETEIVRSTVPYLEKRKRLLITSQREADAWSDELSYDVTKPINLPEDYTPLRAVSVLAGVRLAHFVPVAFAIAYDRTEASAVSAINYLTASAEHQFEPPTDLATFAKSEVMSEVYRIAKSYLGHISEDERSIGSVLLHELDTQLKAETLNRLNRRFRSKMLAAAYEEHREALIALARGDSPKDMSLALVRARPDVYGQLMSLFGDRFKYLGPLRDEPKVVYPMEGAVDPQNVGLRGEYTAAVLDLNKYHHVEYVSPDKFEQDGVRATSSHATLRAAVVEWLSYLGVVEGLETTDLGVYGHELRVKTEPEGTLHNLLHVGVGVSQVLPILVMSLLAPQGAVLVFEQPELHLHPRVQTRLADFFLSLTCQKKQCIVETHSEYLINRLRLRAALDERDETHSRVALYFVEKSAGRSSYQRVGISEYGAVTDWPRGFFDQTPQEAESILRAAIAKRKHRRPRDA